MAHIIKADVSQTEENFGCAWSDETGTVVVTAETMDKLKENFEESLRFHIEGCLEDGDEVPEYLANGDYEVEYNVK